MDSQLAARLALFVRAADPDRYFASLFAPAARRPFLHALYAFNHEVARVAESVREPMLGAIRLEWWRETAEGAANGAPRNLDAARGLAALFGECGLALKDVEDVLAARSFDSSPEHFADFAALESYLDATGGALMRLGAQILGARCDTRAAALAYGLAGLLRSLPFHNARHKLYLPLDLLAALDLAPDDFFAHPHDPRVAAAVRQAAIRALDHFRAARKGARAGLALPAILPAALVPVYIRRLGREVALPRKQMALLAAAMKKRL